VERVPSSAQNATCRPSAVHRGYQSSRSGSPVRGCAGPPVAHVVAVLQRARRSAVEVPALQVAPLVVPATVGGRPAPADAAPALPAPRRAPTGGDPLSPREQDVLRLIAEGRSNQRIGRELYLSPETVETHVAALFAKPGLAPFSDDNRRVLAALAWVRAG
jgi:DNA-binding NarL/FixJ family response regulator